MIIGFGFGSPLMALIMLILTSFISYLIFKSFFSTRKGYRKMESDREMRRQYYIEQRERAHQMIKEFDLTDAEIEQRLNEEFQTK